MNIETKPYKYNEFKQFLRFELGMSDNSVISYLSDLETLYKFYKKDIKEIIKGYGFSCELKCDV